MTKNIKKTSDIIRLILFLSEGILSKMELFFCQKVLLLLIVLFSAFLQCGSNSVGKLVILLFYYYHLQNDLPPSFREDLRD